jgi:hypothetical protein
MFCKSGLVALIAGLALGAASANAGTAAFDLTGGSISGTPGQPGAEGTAHFDQITLAGLAPYNGPYNVFGSITVDLSSLTSPFATTISVPDYSLSLGAEMTPQSTGATSGYGAFAFNSTGNSQIDALLGQFHSYSYANLSFSGNNLTGGTFTLSTAAVPEPSAFAMGATALVGLMAVRRRRAKSAA